MTLKEVLRETYYEATKNYPREGSAITDMMINTLAILLQPSYADIESLKTQTNLVNPADTSVNQLLPAIVDAIASKFFVYRIKGSKVSGPVQLTMAERVNVSIPTGTLFTTPKGKSFQVTRDYFYAAAQLSDNGAGGFTVPNITVQAVQAGTDYKISKGEISTINIAPPALLSVTNPQDFTGGADEETNSQLLARLIDGYSTRGMDSQPGIQYKLLTNQASLVEKVAVIGAGDPEMVRDRIFSVTEAGAMPYVSGDFTNKKVATTSNPHVAMKRFGANTSPALTDFTGEFSQADYLNIQAAGDTSFFLSSGLIFSDDFTRKDESGADIVTNSPGNGWRVAETGAELEYGGNSAIKVGNGSLILGRLDGVDPDLAEQEKLLKYGPSPVIQRRLTSTKGIKITGKFSTSDSMRRPSFVTVAKNSNPTKGRAYEGFGFAWMISDPGGRPNLYIVDNDSVDSRLTVVGSEIYNSKGVESFLAAGSKTINTNTDYSFELIINLPADGNEATATELRVWESSGDRPASADLSYGAYTPINKRSLDLQGNSQSIDAMDMGIGVINGGSALWTYQDVEVVGIAEEYAQALFKMNLTGFTATPNVQTSVIAIFRGSGALSELPADGAQLKVYNHSTGAWELIYEHTGSSLFAYRAILNLDAVKHISDGVATFMVNSKYPHSGTPATPVFSELYIDYFGLQQSLAYTSVGGMVDVYVKTPATANYNSLFADSVDINSVPSQYSLSAANGFSLPIGRIVSIDILVDGSPTGAQLVENQEYRVVTVDQGVRGSANENIVVLFDESVQGIDVRVNYEYFIGIQSLQDYVDLPENKKNDVSLLVKHFLPVFVEVSLTANFASVDMVSAIRKLIWEEGDQIEISDILNLVYENGASYINLNSVTVTSFYYDADGNRIETSHTNTVTKPDRSFMFVPESVSISTS